MTVLTVLSTSINRMVRIEHEGGLRMMSTEPSPGTTSLPLHWAGASVSFAAVRYQPKGQRLRLHQPEVGEVKLYIEVDNDVYSTTHFKQTLQRAS